MEDFRHFTAVGCGLSKEHAALEFVEDLKRLFPTRKGYYDLMVRSPLEYSTEKEFGTNLVNHIYTMRGNWRLLADMTISDETVKL